MNLLHMEYVSHHTFTPNDFIVKHNHACYELVYYDKGSGDTVYNSVTTHKYTPHTYAIYAPYTYHTESHYTESHMYCVGVHLDEDYPLIPNEGLYSDNDHTILSLITQVLEETTQKRPFYNLASESYLNQLFIQHHRNFGLTTSSTRLNSLDNVIKYLDENFSQNINVYMLAEMSGYSYDYFRHQFKKAVGESPKDYILLKRISYAKQLLSGGNLSVTEISYLCGFSSPSEFNKTFKNRVGVTPLKYRQKRNDVFDGVDTLHQKL